MKEINEPKKIAESESYFFHFATEQEHPELIRDQFWDDVFPELPYTAAAEETRNADPVMGAATRVEVPEADAEFLPMNDEEEEEEEEEDDFNERGSSQEEEEEEEDDDRGIGTPGKK